jgi:beta-N-acetylhexosaminidase
VRLRDRRDAGSVQCDAVLGVVLASLALTTHAAAAAADPTAGMSTRQLAGQHIVIGFNGTSPSSSLLRLIHRGELGGVILFGANISSRSQVRSLTHKLQKARPAGAPPLLVSTDQEGGQVKRFSGAPARSPAGIGAKNSATYARKQGAATARNLRGVGVNVNLAPVLDVARKGSIMERQQRSFSRSASRVTRIGGAFARGLDANKVASTGKHFPGLGAATQNEDLHLNRIKASLKTLRAKDEHPYSAQPGALKLVMLSTALYPALGSSGPALFSKRIAGTELRGHVGFKGVTITDALDAPALNPYGSLGRRGVLATKAGVDLLLYSGSGSGTTDALVKAVRSGSISKPALRSSVRRTLELRASLR